MSNRAVSNKNKKEVLIEIQGEALDFLDDDAPMATENI
jgi:hypothetical protein